MGLLRVSRRVAGELLDVPKGVAGAAAMATAAAIVGAVGGFARGSTSGWVLAAAAVVLLPVDLVLVRWFARSIGDAARAPLPDPASPAVPEPCSNVRTIRTGSETDDVGP